MPSPLPRRFKRFLTYGSDFHQLLLSTLRGLLQDEQRSVRLTGARLAEEETYKIPTRCAKDTSTGNRAGDGAGDAWRGGKQ